MRAAFRSDFDPDQAFIVRKPLRLAGVDLAPGAEFPKDAVPTRRLRQLFDSRLLAYPIESSRDIIRPSAPHRFGKWLDRLRKPQVRLGPSQAPRAKFHLPTSLQPGPGVEIRASDVPSEFDDGDLQPVLSKTKPVDAPSLQHMLALEPRVQRSAAPDPDRPGAYIKIPENWQGLAWPKLLQLASNFSRVRLMNKLEATDAIEAELARRAWTA